MLDMQKRMLKRRELYSDDEKAWLTELRDTIAPRIRSQLESFSFQNKNDNSDQSHEGLPEELNSLQPTPLLYTRCLQNLRKITATNRWPVTSVARSKVIKNLAAAAQNASCFSSDEQETGLQSGSFTGESIPYIETSSNLLYIFLFEPKLTRMTHLVQLLTPNLKMASY